MSYAEDYDHDLPDDEEGYSTSCNRCGQTGLTWGHDGRKWYLIDEDCNAHVCDMQKAATDDFEIVE